MTERIKISEMDSTTTLNNSDTIPIVQTGTNKKVSFSSLKSNLEIDLSQVTDAGTAAALDVPTSGDASSGQVVKGDDTRLSDSRTPVTHTHSTTDITSGTISTARLGSSTASSSNFLRGDQTWSAITEANVTNLVNDLAGKASTTHTHSTTDITSGTISTARLGSGSASSSTYLRGDQTWATVTTGWVGAATSNLNMAGYNISDVLNIYGTNISASIVEIGTLTITDGGTITGGSGAMQFGGGNIAGVGDFTATNITGTTYYGDGSNLTGVAGGWTGSATSDLDMQSYSINNGGNITASYFYGDGSNLTGVAAGWTGTATSNLDMQNYIITNVQSVSTEIILYNASTADASAGQNELYMSSTKNNTICFKDTNQKVHILNKFDPVTYSLCGGL